MSQLALLLADGTSFDAEFGAGLTSHLPMALIALDRLGASDMRLEGFSRHYSSRLRPARPREPWPAGEAWTQRLGDPSA